MYDWIQNHILGVHGPERGEGLIILYHYIYT